MSNGRILFGIILALVLVALVAGAGWYAYNVGVARGLVMETGSVPPLENGAPVPYSAPFGYYPYWGFHYPFGFGFGLLGCLVPLLFLFLFFGLFRFLFWRPRWGWDGRHGGWDPARGEIPPRIKEWHRQLHEEERARPTAEAS
jgi:hypothetical protein